MLIVLAGFIATTVRNIHMDQFAWKINTSAYG
jgi:hypothetical protein